MTTNKDLLVQIAEFDKNRKKGSLLVKKIIPTKK